MVQSDVVTAMIVAGGAGTRLAPLTLDVPKPLVAFCGRPFLEGVITRLAHAGIRRVLLVVGAQTQPFSAFAAAVRATSGIAVDLVDEPTPLDTAGGVHRALDIVDDEVFLVLNGDILTDLDLTALIERHVDSGAGATLALTRVNDPSSYGVCVLEGDRVRAFVEKPAPGELADERLAGHDTVNAGTYVLHRRLFTPYGQGRLSFERQVFPDALARGEQLGGWVSPAYWADLGTPERYLDGHRAALDGRVRWPALDELPETAPGTWCAADATIDPNATLVAPVVVGPGSTVSSGAVVGPYAVVGAGCRLGHGVRVREAVLHDDVELDADARRLLAGRGVTIGAAVTVGDDVVLGSAVKVVRGAINAATRWSAEQVPPEQRT